MSSKKETENIMTLCLDDNSTSIQDTGVFTPVHPTKGELKGVTMTFYSPSSEKYINASRKQQIAIMKKYAPKNGFRQKSGELTENDLENTEQDMKELLADMLVSWTGIEESKGKPLPATKENCMKIFNNRGLNWLYAQVASWHRDEANFFLDLTKP